MKMKFKKLAVLTTLFLISCQPAQAEPILPAPTQTPQPTPAPSATSTAAPTQTTTPAPRSIHNYHGKWEVYISAPSVSIVKEISFDIDPTDNRITAQWDEGTRTVYLEGSYDPESHIFEGQFYNSDAEVFDFQLVFYPEEQVIRGVLFLPEMLQGLFCAARPGEPRPTPCRPIE